MPMPRSGDETMGVQQASGTARGILGSITMRVELPRTPPPNDSPRGEALELERAKGLGAPAEALAEDAFVLVIRDQETQGVRA